MLIKSFSNIFNNSIDHNPKILCLLLFDFTKYNKLSFKLVFFLYSSIIDVSKKGVSDGNVAIHLNVFLFYLIHFIELRTPTKGPRFSKQSGITVIFSDCVIFLL